MGKFFDTESYSIHNEILDAAREIVREFPEIFTDFEMSPEIPDTTGSIALFVGDDEVISVSTVVDDDGGEFGAIESWFCDCGNWYERGGAGWVDDANDVVMQIVARASKLLGYRFVAAVPDAPVQESDVDPGDDEGVVADFLDFVSNSAGQIVRVLRLDVDSSDWLTVARFVVDIRDDSGEVGRAFWEIRRTPLSD